MPTEYFGGSLLIEEFSGVMMPSPYSRFLASCLVFEGQQQVVDVGCGSGYLAIRSAQLGVPSVIATDIDSRAVSAAKYNVALNHLSKVVEVREGNLLVGCEDVEYVICNPPTFPQTDAISAACIGGSTGYEFIFELIDTLQRRLRPNGVFMCVLSDVFDLPGIFNHARDCRMSYEIVNRKRVSLAKHTEGLIESRGLGERFVDKTEELEVVRFQRLP